jgi:hypothetical protein
LLAEVRAAVVLMVVVALYELFGQDKLGDFLALL